jgi:cell fate regulator YaaT (PSP1 superfamily)
MRVMAVEFVPHGPLHYLDPGDAEYRHGDRVLVPTGDGPEVARCVLGPTDVDWDAPPSLPLCAGPATSDQLTRDVAQRERRAEIRRIAIDAIARHRLPMTVVGVDQLDHDPGADRVAVVYFKAPHRVDFRGLVGDLARTLQSRVELRQVGGRDVAALLGGVGPCGLELCCCSMGPVQEPVPPRVSREQEAANSALQLAGACGRLKCCLAYEQPAYADFAARAPRIGSVVATAAGEGVVSGLAMPLDAVWVRTEEGSVRAFAVADVTIVRPAPEFVPRHARPQGRPHSPDEPPVPGPPSDKPGRRPLLRRQRRQRPES